MLNKILIVGNLYKQNLFLSVKFYKNSNIFNYSVQKLFKVFVSETSWL